MSEFIVDLVQKLILDILDNLGIPDNMVNPLYYTIFAAFIILVCIALELFGRGVILSLFYRITKNSRRPIFSFLTPLPLRSAFVCSRNRPDMICIRISEDLLSDKIEECKKNTVRTKVRTV